MKPLYRIYIEGSLHDETPSLRRARSLQRKFEAEGWNVKLIKFTSTVVGELGVAI